MVMYMPKGIVNILGSEINFPNILFWLGKMVDFGCWCRALFLLPWCMMPSTLPGYLGLFLIGESLLPSLFYIFALGNRQNISNMIPTSGCYINLMYVD